MSDRDDVLKNYGALESFFPIEYPHVNLPILGFGLFRLKEHFPVWISSFHAILCYC